MIQPGPHKYKGKVRFPSLMLNLGISLPFILILSQKYQLVEMKQGKQKRFTEELCSVRFRQMGLVLYRKRGEVEIYEMRMLLWYAPRTSIAEGRYAVPIKRRDSRTGEKGAPDVSKRARSGAQSWKTAPKMQPHTGGEIMRLKSGQFEAKVRPIYLYI